MKIKKLLVVAAIKIRWAYFHLSPSYIKFYVDSDLSEAYFYNIKTNVIYSNYSVKMGGE